LQFTHDLSALKAEREKGRYEVGTQPNVVQLRNGADDETTRSVTESHGEEDHLVAGPRDHSGDGSNDAALARRLEEHGYSGLRDGRKGKPSFRRVPLKTCEEVLSLYREKYFDLSIRHFHEKLARRTELS
jgi:hypothetical protein